MGEAGAIELQVGGGAVEAVVISAVVAVIAVGLGALAGNQNVVLLTVGTLGEGITGGTVRWTWSTSTRSCNRVTAVWASAVALIVVQKIPTAAFSAIGI